MPITMNDRRAAWAQATLTTFAQITGLNLAETEVALGDLLTDLRHLAHQSGIDFNEVADRSAARFDEELADPDPDIGELADAPPPAGDLIDRYMAHIAQEQGAAVTESRRLVQAAQADLNARGGGMIFVPDGVLTVMDRANYLGNMLVALRTLQTNRAALTQRAGGDVGPLAPILADLRRREAVAAALAEHLGDKDDADEESDAEWRRQQGAQLAYQHAIALLTGDSTPVSTDAIAASAAIANDATMRAWSHLVIISANGEADLTFATSYEAALNYVRLRAQENGWDKESRHQGEIDLTNASLEALDAMYRGDDDPA